MECHGDYKIYPWNLGESNKVISVLGGRAQNVVKEIKQYQKKWLQNVQRMGTNRILKQALQQASVTYGTRVKRGTKNDFERHSE
jgi:hypothetical protein